MRALVTYTLARVGLFLVVYGLLWLLVRDTLAWDSVSAVWTALIAVIVSSVLSLVLLRRLRDSLAAEIARRASAQRGHGQSGEDAGRIDQLRQPGVAEDGDQR